MKRNDDFDFDENRGDEYGSEPAPIEKIPGFYEVDLSGAAEPLSPALSAPTPRYPARPEKRDASDDDFKISFDFDREYNDVPSEAPIRPRREKRTGCLGGVLTALFVLCISATLGCLAWLAATDVFGFGSGEETVEITVPRDFTVDQIADELEELGLIKYKSLFKLYASLAHVEEEDKINPGTYLLKMNYDYMALVSGMSKRGGVRVEVNVVFPEGFTLAKIFERLEEYNVCFADELWAAAANTEFDYSFLEGIPALGDKHRLEGFLFPDKYAFYINDTPERVIKKMLDNFKKRMTAEYLELVEASEYSMRDIIIIASMIEREAGTDSDRPKIASVIYNRLKSSSYPRLEIDATIHYVIAETGEAFSTDLDSPYNTYLVSGLPYGPISNPGIKSIAAALKPETSKNYFYALHKDRSHRFFKDYDAFQKFVRSDEYGG
ncbi:MAG: endolytic transglycosylase MltG [Oscillospiraceae bacterium]|nr:endolytic transglycosylase MltG [Oscillospiraceae bacterium]